MFDIKDLYELAVEHWLFDKKAYPGLDRLTEEQKLTFSANHILLHANTNLGDLAKYIENANHGETPDPQALTKASWKLILHGLRLGAVAGLSAEQLAEEIVAWSKRYS